LFWQTDNTVLFDEDDNVFVDLSMFARTIAGLETMDNCTITLRQLITEVGFEQIQYWHRTHGVSLWDVIVGRYDG
jgi:hypothetical protein